ncbi:putative isoleucine N-monooxygenase [Helianthus anomalus]
MLSYSTGRRGGCPGVLLGSTMAVMLLARLIVSYKASPGSCHPMNHMLISRRTCKIYGRLSRCWL